MIVVFLLGCEELHPPVYGHLEYDLDHALARFECHNPYLLVGERVLGCDGHAWNATIPQCIELTTTTTKAPTLKQHSRNTELTSVSTTAKASTVLLIITLLHGYVNFQSDLKWFLCHWEKHIISQETVVISFVAKNKTISNK